MGCTDTSGAYRFPKQGDWLGLEVEVCFDYDTSRTFQGVIVREDCEAPGILIIKLVDGRHVLSTECQYRFRPRQVSATEWDVITGGL